MLEKIIGAIVHATKTQLQAPTALLCQFIQLRCDLFYGRYVCNRHTTSITRHAPPLNCRDLFPHKTLLEMDERAKRCCETSLIVQTYRKSQNQLQFNNKQKPWTKNVNESQRGCLLPKPLLSLPFLFRQPLQRLTKQTRMTN